MYVQTQNPGWQEVIWDEAAVLKLIQDDFPWFLDTYLSYPRLVQRSDVMRYMVLYKYGGVYLDADVSLLTASSSSCAVRS
jgi:mannosyltransferase OCH1-like enzyme